ncbi:MAG: hypothetical protein MUO82_03755 [Candidatus Thermoplasmatota archaeon]|nr:hypothetical protein [Candidatus Thermoplasmatota archaeon]
MILSLLGLFLTGYYSKRKIVKIICASIFPVILYVHFFYFSYIPTQDSGSAKAMFEIFHYTGINPVVEPYFHYPIFFTLNEVASQILGFNANNLAIIFFTLFGFLIALYIYLFISKTIENDTHQIAFLAIPIYFIATYTYLNYQWIPQTLALVFFLMLLILLFNKKKPEYKFLSIIIFTILVFTHLFIPVIYLIFLGIYAIKKKEFRNSFLLMGCIYTTVLIYYTTFYLPTIIEAFKESIYGFGKEYAINISRSLLEPKGILSQIISMVNRTIIPLTWIVLSIGSFIWFIKRKISLPAIALGITAGFYLGIGMFYSILGTRALQILCIPLLIGIGFFISKWKKPTLLLVTIIIILSIFGPMRSSYDEYQFQLNEEENACNFLANTIPVEKSTKIAMGGIHFGYFTKKFIFINVDKNDYNNSWALAPRTSEFYNVFNGSMKENEYILYNPNLHKEIISYGYTNKEVDIIKEKMLYNNNIIYVCGKTYILTGLPNISEK